MEMNPEGKARQRSPRPVQGPSSGWSGFSRPAGATWRGTSWRDRVGVWGRGPARRPGPYRVGASYVVAGGVRCVGVRFAGRSTGAGATNGLATVRYRVGA